MKRRKRFPWIVIITVFLFAFILVGVVFYVWNQLRMNTYINKKYAFKIGYPSEWTFRENINGAVVIFYSPIENSLDFFQDNINIVIQDISSHPLTLEDYSKEAVDQMKMVFGDNMQIQELSNMTIDGMPAKKFVFLGKGPDAELKYMSVWMIDNNTVYQLTYLAIASQYPNYLLKIYAMLMTFHRLSSEEVNSY